MPNNRYIVACYKAHSDIFVRVHRNFDLVFKLCEIAKISQNKDIFSLLVLPIEEYFEMNLFKISVVFFKLKDDIIELLQEAYEVKV